MRQLNNLLSAVIPIVLIILLIWIPRGVDAMLCLEGADCIRDASCDYCEGIACTRVTSYNMEDNKEVALTCLPHDTRSPLAYRNFPYEEEGCRHVGDRQICVCFSGDYCNSSEHSFRLQLIALISLFIVLIRTYV